MKSRRRFGHESVAASESVPNPEAVELLEGLEGDEQIDLVREFERMVGVLHAHLGTKPAQARPRSSTGNRSGAPRSPRPARSGGGDAKPASHHSGQRHR